MAGVMDAQIIEFASYFPENSDFRKLASEIYGATKVKNFKPPRTFRFPSPKLPDGIMRFPGGPGGDDFEPVEQDGGDRKLKALAKSPEVKTIVNNYSFTINKQSTINDQALREISSRLRDVERETKKLRFSGELKAALISLVIATTANVLAHKINSEPEAPKEIYIVSTQSDNLNVRRSPDFDTNENMIGSIPRLEQVIVLGEFENSYHISCVGIDGLDEYSDCYVSKDYISRFVPIER